MQIIPVPTGCEPRSIVLAIEGFVEIVSVRSEAHSLAITDGTGQVLCARLYRPTRPGYVITTRLSSNPFGMRHEIGSRLIGTYSCAPLTKKCQRMGKN